MGLPTLADTGADAETSCRSGPLRSMADRNGQVVIGSAGFPLLVIGIGEEDEVVLTRCIDAGCGDRFSLGITAAGSEWRLISCAEVSYEGIGIINEAILR